MYAISFFFCDSKVRSCTYNRCVFKWSRREKAREHTTQINCFSTPHSYCICRCRPFLYLYLCPQPLGHSNNRWFSVCVGENCIPIETGFQDVFPSIVYTGRNQPEEMKTRILDKSSAHLTNCVSMSSQNSIRYQIRERFSWVIWLEIYVSFQQKMIPLMDGSSIIFM